MLLTFKRDQLHTTPTASPEREALICMFLRKEELNNPAHFPDVFEEEIALSPGLEFAPIGFLRLVQASLLAGSFPRPVDVMAEQHPALSPPLDIAYAFLFAQVLCFHVVISLAGISNSSHDEHPAMGMGFVAKSLLLLLPCRKLLRIPEWSEA